MIDILDLIRDGRSNIVIQVNGQDLLDFADALLKRATDNAMKSLEKKNDKEYLTKKEVMSLLKVCGTTLWIWNRDNYLKPVKIGRRVLYRKCDVDDLLTPSKY
jgi:predicted DNA-binding transcriptional regulator AlpA